MSTHFCFGLMSRSRVVDASGTPVPYSPMQLTSSNFGFPKGPGSDLDGRGTRSGSTTDEKFDALLSKFVHFETQIPSITNSHITQTLGDFSTGLTEMEQNLNALTTRRCKLETSAASGSSGPDWARSCNILRLSDGSTATGSLGSRGPGSSDDNRNTRRRLDTFSSTEDEHARSAVLLRFPCEQFTTLGLRIGSMAFGKSPTCQTTTSLSEFTAKQVHHQPDLYLKKELNVRTLWPDTRMMVPCWRKGLQKCVVQISLFFELIKAVIFVISCGSDFFELIENRKGDKFYRGILLWNYIFCAVDRTLSRPFCPNLRFCFARVYMAWTLGVEQRPRRRPVRVPGRRHEAGAVVCALALRAALVHCRPGAIDACDALGAHGSRPASMYDGRLCELCVTQFFSLPNF